jgi:hypothetical protein
VLAPPLDPAEDAAFRRVVEAVRGS